MSKSFVLLAILLLSCGCSFASGQQVAGIYLPSHEGDFFVPCDWKENYLVVSSDAVLAKARTVAMRDARPSAYVEGVVLLVTAPKSHNASVTGAYRFLKVTAVAPYPGRCSAVPKPPEAANNSFKPKPLRGSA